MILHAFSKKLREDFCQDFPAEVILYEWLADILSRPPLAGDHVAQVIHTEVAMAEPIRRTDPLEAHHFEGRSQSGRKLLEALLSYCKSYERWQFSRWLHHLRASDFPIP
jgi:hypothetical protein